MENIILRAKVNPTLLSSRNLDENKDFILERIQSKKDELIDICKRINVINLMFGIDIRGVNELYVILKTTTKVTLDTTTKKKLKDIFHPEFITIEFEDERMSNITASFFSDVDKKTLKDYYNSNYDNIFNHFATIRNVNKNYESYMKNIEIFFNK